MIILNFEDVRFLTYPFSYYYAFLCTNSLHACTCIIVGISIVHCALSVVVVEVVVRALLTYLEKSSVDLGAY
jgi:hypothetical protein